MLSSWQINTANLTSSSDKLCNNQSFIFLQSRGFLSTKRVVPVILVMVMPLDGNPKSSRDQVL
jgi:hypothetical protein